MNQEDAAQALAERVRDGMFANDAASRALGMEIQAIGPASATLCMRVRPDMLNGFSICHGGFITLLADSAFAFACNAGNRVTVASGLSIDFVSPVQGGELLRAHAERVSQAGRTSVYDVRVTGDDDRLVALMRGRAHRLADRAVVPDGEGSAA